jgi:hypothetical protein
VPTKAPRPNTSTRQSQSVERKSRVGILKSRPKQSSSWLMYPVFFTTANEQLQMYGYEFSWASFQVIEVMSSSTFKEKTIGYLAASLSFKPDTDVLMLATNLIKKAFSYLEVTNDRILLLRRAPKLVSRLTVWPILLHRDWQWTCSPIYSPC